MLTPWKSPCVHTAPISIYVVIFLTQTVILRWEMAGEEHLQKLHDIQSDGRGRLDCAAVKAAFRAEKVETLTEGFPAVFMSGGPDLEGLTKSTSQPGTTIPVKVTGKASGAHPTLCCSCAVKDGKDRGIAASLDCVQNHVRIAAGIVRLSGPSSATMANRSGWRPVCCAGYVYTFPNICSFKQEMQANSMASATAGIISLAGLSAESRSRMPKRQACNAAPAARL